MVSSPPCSTSTLNYLITSLSLSLSLSLPLSQLFVSFPFDHVSATPQHQLSVSPIISLQTSDTISSPCSVNLCEPLHKLFNTEIVNHCLGYILTGVHSIYGQQCFEPACGGKTLDVNKLIAQFPRLGELYSTSFAA